MNHRARWAPDRLSRGRRVAMVSAWLAVTASTVGAQTATSPPADVRQSVRLPDTTVFIVESYYRIRWGGEEEFMALFRKNHVPFLHRQLEKGILLEVRLDAPHEHQTEDARWDLRMTLVYPDAAAAYRTDKITEADYQVLVPSDTADTRFQREERRRFELLLAHWDLNVRPVEAIRRDR